jgi:3-hydroxyisobutyrate dehydrogenase-like beta-hydroxyacid dehydrogenase
VAELLRPLGASVEVLHGEAGLAAERKLLRSVFFKGWAAAVVEALEAARAAGLEDWLRADIVEELSHADAATVDRLVEGTYRHAVRRADEMSAATEMLRELGVDPAVAAASRALLTRLAHGSS